MTYQRYYSNLPVVQNLYKRTGANSAQTVRPERATPSASVKRSTVGLRAEIVDQALAAGPHLQHSPTSVAFARLSRRNSLPSKLRRGFPEQGITAASRVGSLGRMQYPTRVEGFLDEFSCETFGNAIFDRRAELPVRFSSSLFVASA